MRSHRQITAARVGASLLKARKRMGWTQRDLADALDLKSHTQISRWEDGECTPGLAVLYRIAQLYKCQLFDLIPETINAAR